MESQGIERKYLTSWIIGAVIVLLADGWIAYRMFQPDCTAPGIAEFIVLVVVPAVYLTLMFITLRRP
ncbi:MAG: hypothetical protein RIB59_10645 [Rhodospirillales bacterium]